MVTHMVFSPVLFFGFAVGALGCPTLTAAGPLVVFRLGLLFFFLFFDVDFRDESDLVAAAAAGDGGSLGPPPSAPGLRVVATAATAADAAAEEEDDEEAAALSPGHSSLWPARHAARWQASLQYFRCRQPEKKFRC